MMRSKMTKTQRCITISTDVPSRMSEASRIDPPLSPNRKKLARVRPTHSTPRVSCSPVASHVFSLFNASAFTEHLLRTRLKLTKRRVAWTNEMATRVPDVRTCIRTDQVRRTKCSAFCNPSNACVHMMT